MFYFDPSPDNSFDYTEYPVPGVKLGGKQVYVRVGRTSLPVITDGTWLAINGPVIPGITELIDVKFVAFNSSTGTRMTNAYDQTAFEIDGNRLRIVCKNGGFGSQAMTITAYYTKA